MFHGGEKEYFKKLISYRLGLLTEGLKLDIFRQNWSFKITGQLFYPMLKCS
jgi:hypothetical protein